MRTVIACVLVVLALSVAAFTVVSAQRATEPAPTKVAEAKVAQAAAPATSRATVGQAPLSAQSPLFARPQPAAAAPVAPAAAPVVPVAVPPAAAAPATPAVITTPAAPAAAPAPAAAQPPPPAAAPAPVAVNCPGNANALGVSRVVEIDTTGGPGFGFEHFKMYDFLQPGEVVLTFDDGPWPRNTPAVLAALASHCTKATFFAIGKHAMWHPEILRQVAAAGHTVGAHTWSHADLSKKTPEQAKEEIEKGFSAVKLALGQAPAPFFRFPALRHPPEMMSYLGTRGIAVFSTDLDSFDFKIHKPQAVVQSVMNKLKKHGKGIILMHDFQSGTAHGAAELLRELKAGGYRVVHMVPKQKATTVAEYDEMVAKELKLPQASAQPLSNVVRTISGN